MPSGFNPGKKTHAYTFGVSREAYRKVFLEQLPLRDLSIPGPGAYSPPEKMCREGRQITLHIKVSMRSLHLLQTLCPPVQDQVQELTRP